MYRLLATTIAALVLTAGTALTASATTVTPGGNFTATGTAMFRLSGGNSGFQGSCSVTLQGNLTASTGAFSITSATFGYPCGQQGSVGVSARIDLPVTGTTVAQGTGGGPGWSYPVNITAYLDVISGPAPRWGVSCDSPRSILWFWQNNGTAGAPATKLTTSGYEWFATASQNSATCEIYLDTTLSASQGFH